VHLVARLLELRRHLRDKGILTAGDGGSWRVEIGNLLICERNPEFFVAVAGAR
jgi:alpha-glucosidase